VPEPGQTINLSPQVKERFAGQLGDWITQLENDNGDLYRNIQLYWNRYDARPLHKTRTQPWENASNIVLPVIPTFVDAVSARLWGQLHTPTRTWMIRTDNELFYDMGQSVSEFMNREARTTFDIQSVTYDWCHEAAVVGSSALWVTWGRKLAYRWNPKSRRVQTYLVNQGPVVEHVPREFIIWERDRLLQESSTVVRQSLKSWNDLVYEHHNSDWDITDCQQYEGLDGPSGGVLSERRRLEGVSESMGYAEPHDIREVWIDYPMAQLLGRNPSGAVPRELDDPSHEQTPIVVTYHRKAQKILRMVAHPYYIQRWPGLDIYFRRVSGRGYSPGLAKRLEHIQHAGTTMINQTVDGLTMANTLKFFTQDPAHRNMRWNPFHPIYVSNINDIKDVRAGQQVLPDIQIINLLMVFAERIAGISDPGFGRESRMGGHPSPATNVLVQLQEGGKLLNITLKNIRKQLSTAAEWILNLYQQHETPTNPRLVEALGPKDAELLAQALTLPGTMQFDLHALSESTNPDAERNNAIAISQLTGNFYSFVLRMQSLAENPDPRVSPGVRQTAMKAIEAMNKSYIRFLEASDIDDPDEYALRLRQAMESTLNDAQALAGGIGQPQPAGPVQGPPGGAAGPVPQPSVVDSILGAYGSGPPADGGAPPGF
jgi:hypothetical protein